MAVGKPLGRPPTAEWTEGSAPMVGVLRAHRHKHTQHPLQEHPELRIAGAFCVMRSAIGFYLLWQSVEFGPSKCPHSATTAPLP